MKKLLIALLVLPLLLLAGAFGFVLYNGPRMTVQPHLRAYQAVTPLPPAGTVTVNAPERLPLEKDAVLLKNPFVVTAERLAKGKIYYEYYCIFCHGAGGRGNGPVGSSYTPLPADLSSVRIRNFRDGELLRAMLSGTGHEPVLERVVPPSHRWDLVLYVRSLAGER